MNLSAAIPFALLASIGTGLLMVGLAIWFVLNRRDSARWRLALAAILGALTINSWWLAFIGMAFYKLYILREDT